MPKIILLIPLLLLSCNQEKELLNKKYFDLKEFSESLILSLENQKPEVLKTWQIGKQKETKTTKDIEWTKELSLFVEADLNKSAFVNSYEIFENKGIISYKLKKSESLPVKKMTIEKLKEKDSKEISVEISTSNYLFKNASEIKMKIKNGKLQAYSVFSIQKLFLSKPDTSFVEGQLVGL
ncbi:hypothetical protein EGI26_13890 [Lacihabitans sp. CCS-44]|uniref:hypothetical protein n=1 Tax=Lacihabitans sp. CCS-44 TaxID=2487331 RepID=UPI0020CB8B9D|nr:hypothetical protein [Lacihabitans sp. CCS-44]MCP9756250.1 hypothetical protein [Lacihabitans sp. CCS-44]